MTVVWRGRFAWAPVVACLAGLVLLLAGPAQGSPAYSYQAQPTLTAQQVLQMAEAGNVSLTGITVTGDLTLPTGGIFPGLVSCQLCHFLGALRAPAAVFDRALDLSGSTFDGPADVSGATFKDRVFLDGATFRGTVTMPAARFSDDVSATRATFDAGLNVQRTLFGAKADLTQARFVDADFTATTFVGAFSFFSSEFRGPALFERVDARGDGNFSNAQFMSPSVSQSVTFAKLTAEAPLHFVGNFFSGASGFEGLTSSSSVTFKENHFTDRAMFFMGSVAIHDLRMPVTEVQRVQGRPAEEGVLEILETSAQARGDLGTANDARFQLLALQNGDTSGLHRLVDSIFYRDLGGYLVRPSHPIVAFMLLLVVGGIIRSMPSQWTTVKAWLHRPEGTQKAATRLVRVPHRVVLGFHKVTTEALRGLASALKAAFEARAEIEIHDTERVRSYVWASARWTEFLAYKLLIVVVVLSLGNSNATIRQILDSVRH